MRIVFKKVIHAGPGKGSENVTVYYELSAIFAPQSGMSFVDGNWSAEVTHVTYAVRKQTFICRDQSDTQMIILPLQGFKPPPIEEIVAKYVKKGWTDRVLV